MTKAEFIEKMSALCDEFNKTNSEYKDIFRVEIDFRDYDDDSDYKYFWTTKGFMTYKEFDEEEISE